MCLRRLTKHKTKIQGSKDNQTQFSKGCTFKDQDTQNLRFFRGYSFKDQKTTKLRFLKHVL